MGVTLSVEGIDKLEAAFNRLPGLIEAGVKVGPPGVEYFGFWEFGKISIKPGPKTMWSTNMLGERVVLTIQAPHGYVRVHHQEFLDILKTEMDKIKMSTTSMDGWQKAIEGAADKAAQKCCDLIRESAPVDTGDLRNSIEPAFTGDGALTAGVENEYYGDASFNIGNLGMGG